MAEPVRAGLVLAGGFSTRFEEGDKTLASLAGRSLLAHAIEGVALAVDGVVVSCRQEQLEEFRPIFERFDTPVALAPDPTPDRGPAAGIANALETIQAPLVAVVAADMPFVDGDFLVELFDRIDDEEALVPEVDDHPLPTHAVYRTDALEEAASSALEDGDGSLQDVLERLDVTTVPEETIRSLTARRTFFDVNTAEDLERASELMRDGAAGGGW